MSANSRGGVAELLRLPALFVTGTDTDVGKTVVSCAIARAWREAGEEVCALKPVAAGGNEDSEALSACMSPAGARVFEGIAEMPGNSALVCLERPMAPWTAALLEGRAIDVDAMGTILLKLKSACAERGIKFIAEGAGGALVPLDTTRAVADLIRAATMPAVVVARTELGTINHTLLTVEALSARGVQTAAVVMSRRRTGELTEVERAGLRELDVWLPREVALLWVPHAEAGHAAITEPPDVNQERS